MNEEYSKWIDNYLATNNPFGKCDSATDEMIKQFPELRKVRGHYYCHLWGQRGHWWLVCPDGNIVDPTAQQFPSIGFGVYEEWQEGEKEPTGICMQCGGYCFDGNAACSAECERKLAQYYRLAI